MKHEMINITEKPSISFYGIIAFACLVIGSSGYISYFHAYGFMKYYAFLLTGLFTLYALFTGKVLVKKRNPWNAIVIFSLISVVFLNHSTAIFYLFMLITAWLLFSFHFHFRIIQKLQGFVIGIAIINVVGVYLFYLAPEVLYTITDFVHLPSVSSQIKTLGTQYGINCGLMGEASYTSIVISVGILFLFYNIKKNIYYIILLFMYLATIMLGKRSLILALPVVILITVLFDIYGKNRSKCLAVVIVLLVIIAVSYPLFLGDTLNVILTKGKTGYQGIYISDREVFWDAAIKMFSEEPIWGNGLNSYDIYYSQHSDIQYSFIGSHNSYLQFLAEFGIVGTILYFFAIIGCLKNAFVSVQNRSLNVDEHSITLASLSVMLLLIIYGITGNPFYQPQEFFLFILMTTIINSISNSEYNM